MRFEQFKNTRIQIFIAVCVVFGLLGMLVAYNSGASNEELQQMQVARRVDSERRRLKICNDEVASMGKGHKVSFDKKKNALKLKLEALKMEQTIYDEQNKDLQKQVETCQQQLENLKTEKHGHGTQNATEVINQLKYQIKTARANLDSANVTRMQDRQRLLRLIEAYAKENKHLAQRVKKIHDDARQHANLTLGN